MSKPSLFEFSTLVNAMPTTATPRMQPGNKLVRRKPNMLALEQRFMFDDAALADATHMLDSGSKFSETAVNSGAGPHLLQFATPDSRAADSAVNRAVSSTLLIAQAEAEKLVTEFLARPDAKQQLFTIFNGGQTGPEPSAQWQAALDQFMANLQAGGDAVRVELRSNAELQGAKGAFSAIGTTGQHTIYLNADWLAGNLSAEIGAADSASITKVLVEELGHSFDASLNDGVDTAGDEGELFSRVVMDDAKPLAVSFLSSQDDHGYLTIDGQRVAVEFANLSFVNAYAMVYDLNNDAVINTNERWADKEQNSHFFNTAGLSVAFINDDTGSNLFSGNDVSAIGINIGGSEYFGWISRPIKAGGIVRGFYFWTDTNFNNLITAQNDGNTDGDRNNRDNKGFLLVVDQAWFDQQIGTPTSYTLNNAKDGNLGPIAVSNVGSSSDRVDAALNSLIKPNSAPTPANDVLIVAEDSGATAGNVLTNDSDPDLNPLTVTSFSIGSTSGTLGSANTITGVGSITLSANGSYSFTPEVNYNGPVPPITYTVSDGKLGSATGVLSISVTPVNDPPVSTNDALTVNPSTAVFLSLGDFGTYSDPDNNPLAKIVITSLPASGTLEYDNGTAWVLVTTNQEIFAAQVNAGKLRLTTATADSTIGFKVSDGTAASTAAYTLSITVPATPAGPTATADTGTGSAYDAIEVGVTAGSNATGNVLNNDSGTSIKVTSVFNTVVAASGTTIIQGQYGTLTIAANGSYTYTPDATFNSTVDKLNAGGSVTENFSYTVTDSTGQTATSTLTVKVNGTNDAPVAKDDTNSVKELAALTGGNYGTATGNVLTNDSDVDNSILNVVIGSSTLPNATTYTASGISPISSINATFTDTGANNWASTVPTSYVQFQVKVNGSFVTATQIDGVTPLLVQKTGPTTLVFNQPEALYKYGSGAEYSYTQTSPLKVAAWTTTINSANVSSSNVISITTGDLSSIQVGFVVSGTNVPINTTVLSKTGSTVTLSQAVQIQNGALTFTDPNSTITLAPGQAYLPGSHGYLLISADGSYTYTLTSNALNAGDTATETFTYKTTDGSAESTATLKIRIDGTSGAFTISAANDLLTATEDAVGTIANILSNDPNTTAVTAYTWGGQTATTVGDTLTLSGIGTLSIVSVHPPPPRRFTKQQSDPPPARPQA
jgi:VCBS repeat-containing protein